MKYKELPVPVMEYERELSGITERRAFAKRPGKLGRTGCTTLEWAPAPTMGGDDTAEAIRAMPEQRCKRWISAVEAAHEGRR